MRISISSYRIQVQPQFVRTSWGQEKVPIGDSLDNQLRINTHRLRQSVWIIKVQIVGVALYCNFLQVQSFMKVLFSLQNILLHFFSSFHVSKLLHISIRTQKIHDHIF